MTGSNQMIELDVEELLRRMQQFAQQSLRAMEQHNAEAFAANRKALDTWFAVRGIKLIEKEPVSGT